MNKKLEYYLNDIAKNEAGVSATTLQEIQNSLDFELPQGYIDFMKEFNGGEGEVGENAWLCLFPMEELVEINQDYHLLISQIPNYFLFGNDAADTGYAFNKETKTFHAFGLMSNFSTDSIEFYGIDFEDFIEHLYNL